MLTFSVTNILHVLSSADTRLDGLICNFKQEPQSQLWLW